MSDSLIQPENTAESGTEGLREVLDDLHRACKDIQLSMIATRDGLTMSSLGTVLEPERVGAMCTELLAVCEKTATELQRGNLEQMLVKGGDGCLLLLSAGEHAVLAVMSRPDANLGMVFLEAERAALAISKVI